MAGTGLEHSFKLVGDAEKRVTKMVEWLMSKGFVVNGKAMYRDERVEKGIVRTINLALNNLPF